MKLKYILFFLPLLYIGSAEAQKSAGISNDSIVNYGKPDLYEIGGIDVLGADYLDKDLLITLTGIKVGDQINIPGDETNQALTRLWKQNLFQNVGLYLDKVIGNKAFLVFKVQQKPKLSGFTFLGVKKGEADDIREKINLMKGRVVTDYVQSNTEEVIKEFFIKKGYLKPQVTVTTKADTLNRNSVYLIIKVARGPRVKIENIFFAGNASVKDHKLRHLMKNTKEKRIWNIFSVSRLRPDDYKDDKSKIIDYYNTIGFRDATILKDTMYYDPKNNWLNIFITLKEGDKYYFRNISWDGNTKYSVDQLNKVLQIKKGDIYDQQKLQNRLSNDPDNTVSSMYMDDGYLFFQVNPVETAVVHDSIDLQMRIYEGPQAIIDRINITGNTKTNEHVIRRAIRTKPGDKFSRADVIRTERELATLGFFDPEKIQINPVPHPENGTVDINYSVTEKPSDQVELSAGYGGQGEGLIGSLGVTFNNFSLSNILNKDAWTPLPSGDGQKLSVRVQTNGTVYQAYNASFTEPWLGGNRPTSFTMALYRSLETNGLTPGETGYDKFVTNGLTAGIGWQLKFPDDFFSFQVLGGFEQYLLTNFSQSGFDLNSGIFNNFFIKGTLTRNSLDNFQFPRTGSNIFLSCQLTPPYSLFKTNVANETESQKYQWVEYNRWRFTADWYTPLGGKFVLKASAKAGFLGYYNPSVGLPPFERFQIGGDGNGLGTYNFYAQDLIALRGYPVLTPAIGDPIFNKYTLELRYPFSTNPNAFIYALSFLEAGNAWTSFAQYNPFQLDRSVGLGVRVFLPAFGTIGFDYGVGFDKNIPGSKKLTDYGTFNIVLGMEPD